MMRRVIAGAAAVALAVLVAGCAAGVRDERPRVVVTTNILGDVATNIVGDTADVTVLMKRNADPHSFAISAQEAALMESADLLISNGLGLEEGLKQHLDRATGAGVPAVVAGEHLDVIDYSSDDAASAPDPHFWTDPSRMVDVVDAIAAALIETDGIDAAAVEANAAAYREELAILDADMADAFAGIPGRQRALVTNHHVFGYLAERYDFRLVGAVIPGGTTLAAPSAADLRELTAAIESAGVPAIFAESSQPDRLVTVLAEEAGVDVAVVELFTESLTEPGEGADTYLTMMRTNTDRIVRALSPPDSTSRP